LEFENKFSKDGNGLHFYKENENHTYIYSYSAPSYSNKIFPCFDQPDMKANLVLNVTTESKWTVLSNENI
jgi:aminopeptidase N